MDLKMRCELELPKDKEVIETPIAFFWFDESGICYSIAKRKNKNIKMIRESCKIMKAKTGGKKICLISDTSQTGYYSIEMREELARCLSEIVKAIALVPCTPTGKLFASLLFMRDTGFPSKIFNSLKEAKEWIRHYC